MYINSDDNDRNVVVRIPNGGNGVMIKRIAFFDKYKKTMPKRTPPDALLKPNKIAKKLR
jgi:hypothetical protein